MVRLNWLAAVAVIGALALGLVMTKPAHADVGTATYSTFVSPPGTTLTQDLLGVIPGGSFTGGVAFAPDGDIWVSECRQGNGDGMLYRFDAQTWVPASSMGFGTSEPIHPVTTVGTNLNVGCSLVNHPNGSLYGNSWNGIVRLNGKTGAIIGGPSLGAIADPFPYNVGKTTSIATDPQTGDLYYLTNGDGTGGHALWRVNPTLTTHTLVSSSAFQPYSDVDGFYFSPDGNFIWAATRDFATGTFAVVKWSRATNAIVDSFPISGAFGEGPDGISFQTTTGYVMTNTVAGSFYAITPSQPASPTNPFQVAPPGSGFRGDLSNVGPDGCIYQTNNLTRFASGLVAGNTSLTRICPNFAPPAGVRQIDLGITAVTGPGPFTVGGTVTFNFTASNSVAGTATGVAAALTIPVDLTGCAQTAGTGTFAAGTWTIGTMAPGVTVPMTLTCTLAGAGTQTIDVRIDGNEQDLNQANNTASASVSAAANNPPVAVNDAATTTAGIPVTIAVLGNDSDPDVGDVLTIQSATTPANGTATIVSGQIQYTPNPGFTGPTDTFQYTINDGHGGTATATVTVTITVANRPPVARNDTTTNLWAVNPDFEASVAGWGGTLATVTRVTGPACNLASAKVAADPGAPFYRAYGPTGTLSGNTAGRAVTIGGWVRGEGASVGRSFKVFANVFGSGAGAELSASSHTLTAEWQWVSHTAVIAAADQTAIQAFFQREGDPPTTGEYFYLDGAKAEGGPISTANATPVTVTVLGDDCDPDNDALTVTAVGASPNGVAVINGGGTVTFTPNPGFSGVATFSYTISDGRGGTSTAQVSVTVAPPANQPPVAVDDAVTTTVDTPVTVAVLMNDMDPDGNVLTVIAVGSPTNGTVVLVAGQPQFTPAPGFVGTGTFEYTISDGTATDVGLVTVTINPAPNRPPVAVDDSATTTAGTPVTIAVLTNDSDPDGDTITVTTVGTASNGTVVLVAGQPKYTPNPGFTGTDTFTYDISDGRGGTATATVTVAVNAAPNRPPVAVDDSATTTAGTPVTIAVLTNDSDPDGDTITVTSVGTASNGTVVLVAGQPKYTPNPGFTGTDTFTYTISDGRGGTATATVTVTVNAAPNRPPVAVDDSATTTAGTPVTIAVLTNDSDPDGDTITVTTVGTASNGTVVLVAGQPKYTPNPGFTGTDTFTYTISDGRGGTATATVTVTVNAAPNRPPVAVNDSATTPAGTPVTIAVLTNDSDPDGDTLTVTSVTQPATGGTVAIVGGQPRFTPTAGFTGTTTFTYTISDGRGGTATATVTVTVTPVVDTTRIIVQAAGCLILEVKPSDADYTSDFWQYLPTPAKTLGVNSKQSGSIVRLGSFTAGQELQLGIVVRNTSRTFKMGPASNNGDNLVHARVTALGTNTWNVGFEDIWGGGDGDFNDASADVRPGPCPGPDAVNDAATTPAGTPININVLSNDTGAAPLTITAVGTPSSGTATIVSGQVRYTPAPGFTGTATFTYTITDAGSGTDTATVTVTVTAVVDTTRIIVQAAGCLILEVKPSDADYTSDFWQYLPTPAKTLGVNSKQSGSIVRLGSFTAGQELQLGIVVRNTSKTFKMGPASNNGDNLVHARVTALGTNTWNVGFEDIWGGGDGDFNDASADVRPGPCPGPDAVNDTATTTVGTPVTINARTNDTGSGTLTVIAVTQPASGGSVAIVSGSVVFTPNSGFTGTTTFTYTLRDSTGGTDTATVTVTVAGDERFMTGGGNTYIGSGRNRQKVNIGYELRCRGTGNFELNVRQSGHDDDDNGADAFKLDRITSMYCWDNTAVSSRVPSANWDTMTFTGTGRWKGQGGATIKATLVDAGEPARNDTIEVKITDARGNVVYTGRISGNNQAHGNGPSNPPPPGS